MAGRATQSQHPDVEALQIELAALQSQKDIVQNETLAIAADKKRLREECEAEKAKIEEEIAQKHRDGGVELDILDNAIAVAKEQKAQAEREAEEAQKTIADHAVIKVAHGEAAEKLAATQKAVIETEEKLASLATTKKFAQEWFAGHHASVAELDKQKETLEATLSQLHADIEQASSDKDTLKLNLQEVQKIHADFTAKKDAAARELDGTLGQINERLGARMTLENEIAPLEKVVADHNTAMAEKEAASTERMARASRLEAHVDEKLQHLKELENRFTTEHLARMGYQKTE